MNYGPKVAWEALQVGVRIYYTGDMANHPDHGIITKRHEPNRWGYQQVDVKLDDRRVFRGVQLTGFQPSPGKRFWLHVDWMADRQRQIDEMKADYERLIQRRKEIA